MSKNGNATVWRVRRLEYYYFQQEARGREKITWPIVIIQVINLMLWVGPVFLSLTLSLLIAESLYSITCHKPKRPSSLESTN